MRPANPVCDSTAEWRARTSSRASAVDVIAAAVATARLVTIARQSSGSASIRPRSARSPATSVATSGASTNTAAMRISTRSAIAAGPGATSGRAGDSPSCGASSAGDLSSRSASSTAQVSANLDQRQQHGAGRVEVETKGLIDRDFQRSGRRPAAEHQHQRKRRDAEHEHQTGCAAGKSRHGRPFNQAENARPGHAKNGGVLPVFRRQAFQPHQHQPCRQRQIEKHMRHQDADRP